MNTYSIYLINMYKKNKNNIKIIIFIILILINFRFFYTNIKKIIIEIDLSGGFIGEGGPAKFVRGLNETLPYNTRNCRFISSKKILPNNLDILFSIICSL